MYVMVGEVRERRKGIERFHSTALHAGYYYTCNI